MPDFGWLRVIIERDHQYISPIQYKTYTCHQIGAEAQRVSQRAAQLSGVQDSKSTTDAVAMGVGLVLFWPSLFFIKGDGQTAAELGRLSKKTAEYSLDNLRRQRHLQPLRVQFRSRFDHWTFDRNTEGTSAGEGT